MLTNQQVNEYVFASLSSRLPACNPLQWRRRLLRFPSHGKVLIPARVLSPLSSVLYSPQASSSRMEIHRFQSADELISDKFAASESLSNWGAL